MKKFTVSTLFVCAFMLVALQTQAQMYISGRFLYSQNNEKVIPRGVNEMFIYAGDKSGYNTYAEIKKSGANMVRIMWNTTGSTTDLKNTIYNCVTRGAAIPVVTVNEATCKWANLQTCVNYWLKSDVKTAIQDFKKWTILNIANEAGDGSVTSSQFLTSYKNAITQLRNAGYTVPIMIDASGCGQNLQILKDNWSALLNHDPLKRVIFSAHTYWTDGGNSKFLDMVNYAKNNNMPFLFGEGPQQKAYDCNTNIDYKYVIQICQENQIGWLAWSWGAVQNGDCQAARSFDITTNGVYGNWVSQWSQDVIFYNAYSIQKTSVRPSSITASNPFARVSPLEEGLDEGTRKISLFPNPAKNKVTLSLSKEGVAEVGVEVRNMMGMVVIQKKYALAAAETSVELELSNLASGTYLVRVNRGSQTDVAKVRVER